MSRPFILVTFLCIPICIHGYEYRPNKDTLTTHASLDHQENVYESAPHSTSQWDVNSQAIDSDTSNYQGEDDILTYSDLWTQLTKEATKSLDILSHLYQSWLQEDQPSRHKEGGSSTNSQIQQQKNVNLMDALRNMVYQGLMQIQSVGKGTHMLSHAVNDQVQNLRRRVVSRAQDTQGGVDHVDILQTKDSLDRAMTAWVRGVSRRVDMLKYSLYETLVHAGRQIQGVGEGTKKLSHAVHDGIRQLRRTAVPQNRREDTAQQQNSSLNKALTAWLGGISNSMDYLGSAIYRGLLKIQKVGEHTHNLSHSVAHSISNSRGRAQLSRANVRQQRHQGRRQG